MMKKIITPAIILGILCGLLVAFFMLESNKKTDNKDPDTGRNEITVNSFESCALAGYKVQESYPRRCIAPSGDAFTEDIGDIEYDIVLSTPQPNDTLTSPVAIEGEAVGPWFFEASFTAELVDSEGEILGTAILSTQGEWMTEELVPFKGELEFEDATGGGELILKSANPSGDPSNQKIFSIPVRFN